MNAVDGTTGFVSTHDDILQMLASLEQRDLGHAHMAEMLASGLSPERQLIALTNISRVLVNMVQDETGVSKSGVYAGVRGGVLSVISGGAADIWSRAFRAPRMYLSKRIPTDFGLRA